MPKGWSVLQWAMLRCVLCGLCVLCVPSAEQAAAAAIEPATASVAAPAPSTGALPADGPAPNGDGPTANPPQPVFMNLAWGDPVAKLGASSRVGGDASGPLAIYVKTDDVSRLGPLNVDAIHYMFYEGRLMAIEVLCQDAATVESILKAKYGKPFASSPVDHSGRWLQGDTLAALTTDLLDANAALLLASVSLSARYEAWKKGQNDLKNAW